MPLRELSIRDAYRSEHWSIARDFLSPALAESIEYWRAVGYFTSDAIALLSTGLGPFVERGGRIRLIASPNLTEDDILAISRGLKARDEVIEAAVERELRGPMPDPIRDRLQCVAWLVSHGVLEIKIAYVEVRGELGLFHEKVGILGDSSGDKVVFTGSANETAGGLARNFESIEVFRSWLPEETGRVARRAAEFEDMWSDRTQSLTVIPFPRAAREALRMLEPPTKPNLVVLRLPPGYESPVAQPRTPVVPRSISVRPYQQEAIASWFKARLKGVFRMATGTGKTITALALVCDLVARLRPRRQPLFVVVLCPYQHLVEQWAESAAQFGMSPVKCYESRERWEALLAATINAVVAERSFGIAITTYDTLRTEAFQSQLRRVESMLLLIADEMHNAGAPGTFRALPQKAPLRLGLSATPELWRNEEGTEELFRYFGQPVFEFGLGEAIRAGALTRYNYYPIVVELANEELAAYLDLSVRIGRLLAIQGDGHAGELSNSLSTLLFQRARILANASGKVPRLMELMEELHDTSYNLVYCGDGSGADLHDTGNEGVGTQVDQAVLALGQGLGMKVARYVAETPLPNRRVLLDEFAQGRLQALVAIRCLDEGVDLPATKRAFILASSTNPRQFIQRRGRILRKFPGKDRAELYDLLAIPPWNRLSEEQHVIERRLVKRELQRVVEFAELAENGPQAMNVLLPLRQRYDLLAIRNDSGGHG